MGRDQIDDLYLKLSVSGTDKMCNTVNFENPNDSRSFDLYIKSEMYLVALPVPMQFKR